MYPLVFEAKNVKAVVAYNSPFISGEVFRNVLVNYKITILSCNGNQVNWQNVVSLVLVDEPETFTVLGSGFCKKENGKTTYDLIGSSLWTSSIPIGQGQTLNVKFIVNQSLTAYRDKCCNLRVRNMEHGFSTEGKINEQEIKAIIPYTLTTEFCAGKV